METTGDRWQQIDGVFSAALDLPEAERTAFVASRSRRDPDLRAAVEKLLEPWREEEPLLVTGGAAELWGGLDGEPPRAAHLRAGDRVGPYRIVRRLGQGGMAEVHLAQRADGHFRQTVALKLVHPAFCCKEWLRRFEREREILASLQHPDIARLLDGGKAEDGRPYFAMEYVDGEPIDAYCRRHRLGLGERLRLFVRVGRAVAAAHRNLIVHRDLKPSNILVDREGRVKLLDFGIAELLEPDPSDSRVAAPSRSGSRVMTPEYASPEQIRGRRMTTASDVYQLGLLLYELLTCRRPFSFAQQAPAEIERTICREPPQPPSEAVAAWAADPREAGNRWLRPGRLARGLRGDLDKIVLMALRKQPERRYGSVLQLVEDVQRHLHHRPVLARRDTFSYRLRRFVRRNALATAAAAGVTLLITLLVSFYTLRLTRERDRAQLISGFLSSVLEVTDPWSFPSRDLSARQVLDHGAARIPQELGGQLDIAADMKLLFGKAYGKLGLMDQAQGKMAEALELRRRLFGAVHPAVAESEHHLGSLLFNLSRFDESRALLEQAVATRRQVLGNAHPELARSLIMLGRLVGVSGETERAVAYIEEALNIQEAAYGTDHVALAEGLRQLAMVHVVEKSYGEAIPIFRRALVLEEAAYGPDHPLVAETLRMMADALSSEGDGAAARPLLERALEIFSSALAEDHLAMGRMQRSLAWQLRRSGELERAIEAQSRALAIFEKAYDARNPATQVARHSLAELLLETGRYAEARPLFEGVLAATERALGADSPHLAGTLLALARVALGQGDRQLAGDLHRRARALLRGSGTTDPAFARRQLAQLEAELDGTALRL